jgi:hypothetical protein
VSKDFTLLLQLSREIAQLHDRAVTAERLMVDATAEKSVWRRACYLLASQVAALKPGEHPEDIMKAAERAVRGE